MAYIIGGNNINAGCHMNKKFIARTGEVNRRSSGGIGSKDPVKSSPNIMSSPAKQDDPAGSGLPSAAKEKEQPAVNRQVIALLTKMSNQLATLEQTMKSSGTGGQQPSTGEQGQPVNSNSGDRDQAAEEGNGTANNDSSAAIAQLQQMLCGLLNRPPENPAVSAGGQPADNSDSAANSAAQPEITPETAGQILANAQYELAGELETTLEKLRKIISDSEKIANKISSLLATNNR